MREAKLVTNPQLHSHVLRRVRGTRQPSSASEAVSCAEDAGECAVRAAGMTRGGVDSW